MYHMNIDVHSNCCMPCLFRHDLSIRKKETLLYAPNVNTNDKFSVKHFFVIIIFI